MDVDYYYYLYLPHQKSHYPSLDKETHFQNSNRLLVTNAIISSKSFSDILFENALIARASFRQFLCENK